jgi:hypothetical protein
MMIKLFWRLLTSLSISSASAFAAPSVDVVLNRNTGAVSGFYAGGNCSLKIIREPEAGTDFEITTEFSAGNKHYATGWIIRSEDTLRNGWSVDESGLLLAYTGSDGLTVSTFNLNKVKITGFHQMIDDRAFVCVLRP